MKPKAYNLVLWNGTQTRPYTARELGTLWGLPVNVISMRLQRGERRVDRLKAPVRIYAGNDGYHYPTLEEKREQARVIRYENEFIEQVNTEAAEAEYDI